MVVKSCFWGEMKPFEVYFHTEVMCKMGVEIIKN